ncbi:MAG: SpoIIE family protein phosphatase [Bdellovibrionales bacterium]|nr:SpoIIE family protein phosphatase [Bdellovibrionales bacterium]
MANESVEALKARILELEEEVEDREKDLSVFRRELSSANKRLEVLIGELNQEIKVVQAMQKQLMPTEIPNIQGFEFSSKFVPSFARGGDYFDVFEHEDRSRFGVIVASSTGHVMSALLLSVLLKLTGRMEARRGSEPHLMLKQIIDELLGSIQGEDNADVFYGLFDRRNFSLAFAKTGNVQTLHYDYAAGELRLLKSPNPAISQGYSSEMISQSIALSPRDRLIFCSRGVVEARNLDGKEFGQDRLYKSILEYATRGVHELRNQILFQVQEFSKGQEIPRDMTVVVAEVKDRVIKLAKK